MSTGISNSDLIDLTKTTLTNLPNLDFEYPMKYQQYHVINQWFKSDKIQEESGTSIERNIVLDEDGSAKMVRLYQKTPIGVSDGQKKIAAPWVQSQVHWSVERRELLRNRKPAMYIKLLESRRARATVDLANLLERLAWTTPVNSSDDLNPYGLPYWITKHTANTATSGEFGAYNVRYSGSGNTNTKGGIDGSSSANARWRNYAATYTSVNDEFVLRFRRAFHATNFQSPMTAKDLKEGPSSQYRIYMGLDELVAYEDLATKQNDNNGGDLDKFHGVTTFKRVPVLYAPLLDDDADNPVYAINHAHFYPIIQSGDWMRESEPMFDVEQHNVMTTFIDSSFQIFCDNVRHGGFVLHNVTST